MISDQPQNFNIYPDLDSLEDKLIRIYIFINKSKTFNLVTFKESQDSPNTK